MNKKIVILIVSLMFLSICFYLIPYSSGKLLQSMNDSTTARNFTFSSAGNQLFYISLPKNASVINATLNVTGHDFYNSTIYPAISQLLGGNTAGLAGCGEGQSFNATFNSLSYISIMLGDDGDLGGDDPNAPDCLVNLSFFSLPLSGYPYTDKIGISNNIVVDGSLDVTEHWYNFTLNISVLIIGKSYIWQFNNSNVNRTDCASYGNQGGNPYIGGSEYGGASLCEPSVNDLAFILYGRNSSFPQNFTINVGSDSDYEFNHTGTFNTTNQTIDFSGELNAYLSTCTAVNGNCTIPINITSGSAGIVQINNINIVYLIPTAPTLQNPLNNTFHNTQNINFNCSAISDTDPLKNITLYHNISGAWLRNQSTNVGGTSNYSNWTIPSIPDGGYIYNCLAVNQNGSNITSAFAVNNFTFTIDTKAPVWSDNGTNNSNPLTGATVMFYVNWSDINYHKYIFGWNDTGSWVNTTYTLVSNPYNATSNKTITATENRVIAWKMFANDTAGNLNETDLFYLIVKPQYPYFTSPKNASINFKKYSNFTANITINDNIALNYTIFSTNASGSWSNYSAIAIGGLKNFIFNNSANISVNRSQQVCWKVYANDSNNNLNVSNEYCFAVVNTAPTLASADINNSLPLDDDDLNCTLGAMNDIDGDAITPYYDWLKNEESQGLNTPNISNTLTTAGESWQCRAWVGDTYDNSSNATSAGYSIGTGYVPPIINFTNATSLDGKQSNSINPTNNNTLLNLSVNITDANTGDNWSVVFCRTDGFSNVNCTSSANFLCTSLLNTSVHNLWCTFNISSESAGSFTYYTRVVDNTSLPSSPKSGSAWINHPPSMPAISSPLNNTRTNKNWTLITSSCTDNNAEDIITYSYYNNLSGGFSLLYNGTSSSYNFTNLNETTYYWIANCKDDSNYSIYNSSIYQFDTDFTSPNITLNNPVNDSTYSNSAYPISVPHNFTTASTDLDVCYYNVTLSGGGAVIANTEINCSVPPTGFNISLSATNLSYFLTVNDTADNTVIMKRYFSTEISTEGVGGGGGGIPAECYVDEDCKEFGEAYYCKNYKCVVEVIEPSCGNGICEPEYGEDIIQCPQDCPLSKDIFTSCFDKDITKRVNCIFKQRWFFILITLLGLIGALYLFATKEEEKKRRE